MENILVDPVNCLYVEAQCLVCWTPERTILAQILAWVFVLCSWARRFTLTKPLFTKE